MRRAPGTEIPGTRYTSSLPAGSRLWLFLCLVIVLMISARLAYIPRVTAGSRNQTEILDAVEKAEKDREARLLGYFVHESYALFRRGDRDPSAVMDVATTYIKDKGKSYQVVRESGSRIGRFILKKILQNEEQLSQGQQRADALITSRNYDMSVPDSVVHELYGRNCLVLQINPKRSSPYLLDGKIWVDATNYHVVRVEGTATATAALGLSGRPMVERDYAEVNGFPVAIHARSVSSQVLLGETVVEIKYENYKLNFLGEGAHRVGTSPPK